MMRKFGEALTGKPYPTIESISASIGNDLYVDQYELAYETRVEQDTWRESVCRATKEMVAAVAFGVLIIPVVAVTYWLPNEL